RSRTASPHCHSVSFYASIYHQHLHSFPTRRSSDLNVYMHKCESCGYTQQLDYEKNIECLDESGIDIIAKTVRDGTYRFVCQKCKDRKSTRLNSSHVSISYAVFCLKKKKKRQT